MKTEHTPGPWKAQEVREQKFYRIIDENGVHVAEVDWFIGMGKELPLQTAAEANAKLIAAAPELLDVLTKIVDAKKSDNTKVIGGLIEIAEVIITKATNAH